jgi:hypothetical protein
MTLQVRNGAALERFIVQAIPRATAHLRELLRYYAQPDVQHQVRRIDALAAHGLEPLEDSRRLLAHLYERVRRAAHFPANRSSPVPHEDDLVYAIYTAARAFLLHQELDSGQDDECRRAFEAATAPYRGLIP